MQYNKVYQGDAEKRLSEMPDDWVHTAMTSPPYFGLRDYGMDGQIGLEESLDEYVQNIVDVGKELKRVLRDDGSLWLNLGDSYASRPVGNFNGGGLNENSEEYNESHATSGQIDKSEASGLEEKNKIMVPSRVALALQDDGWILRNELTWHKTNPLPTSAKDRLKNCTEKLFHFVQKKHYWYDLDAIREPYIQNDRSRSENDDEPYGNMYHPKGTNPGDVVKMSTNQFSEAHFAVYPKELCEKPIKASCPPKVCAECGVPWSKKDDSKTGQTWHQECNCDTSQCEPGVVIDMFMGAGTTGLAAQKYGRRYVGIDLNEKYVSIARSRLDNKVENEQHLKNTRFNAKQEVSPMDWGDE